MNSCPPGQLGVRVRDEPAADRSGYRKLAALWALQTGLLRRVTETVVPVELLSAILTPPAPPATPEPAPVVPAVEPTPEPAAPAVPSEIEAPAVPAEEEPGPRP